MLSSNVMIVLIIAMIAVVHSIKLHESPFFDKYQSPFFKWLSEHKYDVKSEEKLAMMLENFATNDQIIEYTHCTLGHNQFSHMSREEWKSYVRAGLGRPSNITTDSTHPTPADISSLPKSVDWVEAGAVTAVKDQGQCGSCWTFSTTGCVEGAYKLKYGSLVSFSEQNLVDCVYKTPEGAADNGCNGGLMNDAFAWMKTNGGICTEEGYPYASRASTTSGQCQQDACTKNANVAPQSFTNVASNSDAAMMSALAQQPVSIAVQADEPSFQLYKSGVVTSPCGARVDHGVLAVGYGSLNGIDYYKVKNSWGPQWGMNGYILLGRGADMPAGGQCGILTGPISYANL